MLIPVIAFGGCGGEGQTPQERGERPTMLQPEEPQAREEPQERDLRAFVAVEDQDEVAILVGPPWRVDDRLSVPDGPHNVVASPDGRHVAITSPPADRVTILRAVDGEVVAQPEISGSPHDADFTPDGDRLWVTAERGRRLVKLSVGEGRTVLERRATAGPHDLAVSPDGDELWVTLGRVPTVEVRSGGDGRLLARPDLGGAPHDLAFQPGGRRIWLSNWTSGRLTVASVAQRTVLERIPAGEVPHHFTFGPRCLWVSDHADGSVVRFDPGPPRRRVGRTDVSDGELHHSAVAGAAVLVAAHDDGEVAVLSRTDGEVTDRVDVGAGPHGIAVSDPRARAARDDGDCV